MGRDAESRWEVSLCPCQKKPKLCLLGEEEVLSTALTARNRNIIHSFIHSFPFIVSEETSMAVIP